MNNKPIVSIVFGSYNRKRFLNLTLNSIRAELHDIPHEIIAIDGGSNDGALELLMQQKDVITITQHNRGEWNNKPIQQRSWGYFMNLGFKIAQGKYICMISDDCLIIPNAIKNGIQNFENLLHDNKKVGALAFWWRNWTPEHLDFKVCKFFKNNIYVNHGLYLASTLKEVNYLDEETYSFYGGDVDLCLKLITHGYTCSDSPNSYIEHYPHATLAIRKQNESVWHQDMKNLQQKWKHIFGEDLGICDNAKKYIDPTNTGNLFRSFEYEPAVLLHATKHTIKWKINALKKRISSLFKI
ncbi:MAG: Glycosyl transferase family 2 [candidate division TM6 bacterium GW2011_GWF2_36_6]|nr:MAG: Glycosyl transferase family 2 [candidate division TM6 bacterium GW2011_GWF2_36_6]